MPRNIPTHSSGMSAFEGPFPACHFPASKWALDPGKFMSFNMSGRILCWLATVSGNVPECVEFPSPGQNMFPSSQPGQTTS